MLCKWQTREQGTSSLCEILSSYENFPHIQNLIMKKLIASWWYHFVIHVAFIMIIVWKYCRNVAVKQLVLATNCMLITSNFQIAVFRIRILFSSTIIMLSHFVSIIKISCCNDFREHISKFDAFRKLSWDAVWEVLISN